MTRVASYEVQFARRGWGVPSRPCCELQERRERRRSKCHGYQYRLDPGPLLICTSSPHWRFHVSKTLPSYSGHPSSLPFQYQTLPSSRQRLAGHLFLAHHQPSSTYPPPTTNHQLETFRPASRPASFTSPLHLSTAEHDLHINIQTDLQLD